MIDASGRFADGDHRLAQALHRAIEVGAQAFVFCGEGLIERVIQLPSRQFGKSFRQILNHMGLLFGGVRT